MTRAFYFWLNGLWFVGAVIGQTYRVQKSVASAGGETYNYRAFQVFRGSDLDIFMVAVAQLVRASDCDSEGRGFKSRQSPHLIQQCVKIHSAAVIVY